jgi:hypothetical protein
MLPSSPSSRTAKARPHDIKRPALKPSGSGSVSERGARVLEHHDLETVVEVLELLSAAQPAAGCLCGHGHPRERLSFSAASATGTKPDA